MLSQAGFERLEELYRSDSFVRGDFGQLLEHARQQATEIENLQREIEINAAVYEMQQRRVLAKIKRIRQMVDELHLDPDAGD